MTVVAQWKTGKIYVYHDIKSITYRPDGFPTLKKRDTIIDLNNDYQVIAVVD